MNDARNPNSADRQGTQTASVNPVLVEVTRGDEVESRHRGAIAVLDARGTVIAEWGDIGRPIYPRSAIKPLQALALLESGAAEAFGVNDEELALACASHNGEAKHVALAHAWLARIGLSESDLECGAHPPMGKAAEEALLRAGTEPGACHNNCSGKHIGMLTTARHLGVPSAGYIDADHPIQVAIRETLTELSDCELSLAPVGTDGCGIPTYAMPLRNLALAMARFAEPEASSSLRSAGAGRIRAAMAAHPFMVAGTGRFCGAVIEASGGTVLVKTGAEGVFVGAIPSRGLGFALKIDDGAKRASEVATAAVLRYLNLLEDEAIARLTDFTQPRLKNWRGCEIGRVRPAAGWLKGH
ncbi:MAG: asparaginase [Alphaproteobacteria bacterium]|nr:asparaginase [Alphaproteobacteria bacterium]